MANKTISGCVNRSTGAITFAGEACDEGNYVGCIERDAPHAGQVAVTIVEKNCPEDTYYGCVDRVTGEFDVSIPDDCCDCVCGCDYPDWDADRTYLTGEFVRYISYCYVSLQNANTGNTPSTSPTWWDEVFCHCCPTGYVEGTLDCGVGGERTPPKYLCARISGVKRCSDDSTITTTYICLQYIDDNSGCFCWEGEGTFDGTSVIVLYRTGPNCEADEDGYVYGASNIWFGAQSGDACNGIGNGLIKANCGNDISFCASCAWSPCGTTLERIAVGYAGHLTVCDPNTGAWWSY